VGLNICEVIQFDSIFSSKKIEKISLERSHKGKKHTFSIGFLRNLFDFFLRLRFFFRSINICNLKVLIILFYFIFALYNLYSLYNFLGLEHISLGLFL
jgi:hypothetical protein